MQTLPVNSPIGYDLMIFLAVCVLAVGFMIWFLIGLILEARKAQRRRVSWYRIHTRYWVSSSADDEFEEEAVYARHTLDSRDYSVFRNLDRLRPLLRSREMSARPGKAS